MIEIVESGCKKCFLDELKPGDCFVLPSSEDIWMVVRWPMKEEWSALNWTQLDAENNQSFFMGLQDLKHRGVRKVQYVASYFEMRAKSQPVSLKNALDAGFEGSSIQVIWKENQPNSKMRYFQAHEEHYGLNLRMGSIYNLTHLMKTGSRGWVAGLMAFEFGKRKLMM